MAKQLNQAGKSTTSNLLQEVAAMKIQIFSRCIGPQIGGKGIHILGAVTCKSLSPTSWGWT